MSRHIDSDERYNYVFGWDQPLQSFYFQKHDPLQDEDNQIIVWLGATADSRMYEVEELVNVASKYGLAINTTMLVKLFREKDEGV